MKRIILMLILLIMFLGCINKDKDFETEEIEANKLVFDKDIFAAEIEIIGIKNKNEININEKFIHVSNFEENIVKVALISKDESIKNGDEIISIKNNKEVKFRINKILKNEEEMIENINKNMKKSFSSTENILYGDYNNNFEVDIYDFQEFANNFGRTNQEPEYNEKYDIYPALKGIDRGWENIFSKNEPDGIIDIYDFYIFSKNFGQKTPIIVNDIVTKLSISLEIQTRDSLGKNINEVVVDWGDGNTSSVIEEFGFFQLSYTYGNPGVYDISIAAIDEDNKKIEYAYKVKISDSDPVIFTDTNLETIIRNMIGNTKFNIYSEDLQEIKELDLSMKQINYLNGIENITELEKLDISGNNINDISKLKELKKLSELKANGNYIQDINNLELLTELNYLDVSNNDIKEISALQNLSNIKYLYLKNCNLSDISSIQNINNLIELDISGNSISEIDSIKNKLNLTKLFMGNNLITDIDNLSELVNLKQLDISYNDIKSLNILNNLTQLSYLNIDKNSSLNLDIGSVDRTIVENLKTAGCEVIFDDKPSDAIIFEDINFEKEIREILGNTNEYILQRDVSAIEELDLYDYWGENQIQSLAGIEYFTNLITLDVSGNNIYSIEHLENLTKLESLNLDGNENLNFIDGLYSMNIKNISSRNTNISSIAGIENMASLVYLDIRNNENLMIKEGNENYNTVQTLLEKGVDVRYDLTVDIVVNFKDIDFETEVRKLIGKNEEDIYSTDLWGIKTLDLSGYGYIQYIDGIEYMVNLEELNLRGNILVEDISMISALQKLEILDLSGTGVLEINVLSTMFSLETLDISNTEIYDIRPVLYLNLGYFYLYNTENIYKEEGSYFFTEIESLIEKGCQVLY